MDGGTNATDQLHKLMLRYLTLDNVESTMLNLVHMIFCFTLFLTSEGFHTQKFTIIIRMQEKQGKKFFATLLFRKRMEYNTNKSNFETILSRCIQLELPVVLPFLQN